MKDSYYNEAQHDSLLRELIPPCSKLLLALLFSGALLSGRAQEFLVKNINTTQETVGSSPTFFVPVGSDVFYFKANDGVHGTELWRSDGTAEGTALVADIAASSANADPASLVNVNGTLFFTATESTHGRELWKSDGTAAGTVLVADINPGTASSNPANLVPLGNLVFFAANSGTNFGNELWKSDGTAAGTVMVRDINPGPTSSNPGGLTIYNNLVFFSANGSVSGVELWRSDGTAGGTFMVKDINTGAVSSNPTNFMVADTSFPVPTNVLYFSANGGATSIELWRSDGTTNGTFLVRDINPGGAASNPQNLVNVNGTLFFSANGGIATGGVELWKSDGTSTGTVIVRDIIAGPTSSNPQNLVNVGGTLFFTASSPPNNGVELWKSDGTTNGTVLVRDIFPGLIGSNPTNLVNLNGTLFFTASNFLTGVELYKSDGTSNGTVVVKDIRPGALSSAPQSLANINGTLIMAANDGVSGFELWKSDGTEDGTVLLKDINAGASASNPTNLVLVNGTVFFAADDGVHGRELWKTDGTEAGTTLVKDINPGGSSNPSSLVSFNGALFFSANNGTNGTELWTSDGTDSGTVLVKDIFAGVSSSNPTNLMVLGNTLFFAAATPSNGAELWKSDGSTSGTVLVKEIDPTPAGSNPRNLVASNNTLFFAANSSTNTVGIWRSDGTAAGTILVKNINFGVPTSNPQSLVVVSNLLFFSATGSAAAGNELWVSDGTTNSTFQVKDINPGSAGSNPQSLINFNGSLYFCASDGVSGAELWKSDGTDAGTVMVADINAGGASSSPTNLFVVNGILYYSATDGVNGRELWQSDGTAGGTFMVGDITGDSTDSSPGPFTVVGNTMYFPAQTPAIGRELFGFVLNHAPAVANPIPDQAGVFGAAFNFIIPPDTFADEDAGQTFTYAAYDLPPGISFTPGTATFSGNFGAVGVFTVTVTATDNGGPIPLSATNTFVVTVQKADPVLTWPTPADIVYGTALGATQLNATANATGTFAYNPAAGAILHAGAGQTLSVAFTPDDAANYNSASTNVLINVLKATLTATAADKSRPYGAANPPLTINYSGFVNGDTASVLDSTPVASTTATPTSPVGTYPITLTGGTDNDYNLLLVNGTLTVTPASLTVMANNATKIYGQPNPTFTGTIFGIQNNDNITATYSSPATDASLAGTYPIVPTLVDPDNKLGNYSATLINGTLTITPAALSVTITAPPSGFVERVGTNILFTGVFTPSGASSSYLAWWTFSSDGMNDIIVPGVVSNQTVSAQVQFAVAGVYSFSLTVTNEFGPSAVATNVNNDLPAYVVIYDPAGGFVTGGGWLNSPAGAYVLDPALVGRATFGFVSKYQHGASIPTGQTQFSFQVADLNFHSTSYDWLLISGAKAQYQGSGTINGEGDFAFKLTATDGQVNGGGGIDKLRVKIWEKQHNVVIYDNQLGASDNSDPTTAIQAGSIVIHKE